MNSTDKLFYLIGWILMAGIAAIAIVQGAGVLHLTELGLPCSFRAVTGYYCPGCGGTHAICSLAAGDFRSCLGNHALVFYTAMGFTLYLLWNTAAILWNRSHAPKEMNLSCQTDHAAKNHIPTGHTVYHIPVLHFYTIYVYIGIAILLIQWVVKNLLFRT